MGDTDTDHGDVAHGPAVYQSRDVAIVGMACVMPGAPDLEHFWSNIVDGVDSVTEVDPSRWDPSLHFDKNFDPADRRPDQEPMSVSKWGGWIPYVGFDALAWGIPPASLASIDPAQLLALKVAGGALDDAGYGQDGGKPFDRDRASVIYATGSGGASELPAGFLMRLLLRSHRAGALPAPLDAYLPQLTEDGLPGVLTSLIAGRVANRLDLGGKNLTVDSACASVLVALDIACTDLIGGGSDLVLCGGVDLHNGAQDYVSFTAAGALSPGGRCRSFDMDADGMTLAEGAGCIVLKRLRDAERDGDRIYAVVKGVAGSSDGRHLGLTAPRQEGQVKAVRRAYATTALSPADVGLLEAHGTGTPTGDRTELETMTETFAEAGAAPGSVVLGTVKSNIGHIKCAAGIASLIKAAKSAYHGLQPPTLHVDRPNEVWDRQTSPFIFLERSRPWLDDQRVVAVSAFGFGGTNFHAVLENPHAPQGGSPTRPSSGRPHWPAEMLVLRAPTRADLDQRLDELARRLDNELGEFRPTDRWRLRDIAVAESSTGTGSVRMALVTRSIEDLASQIQAIRQGRPSPGAHPAAHEPPAERNGDGPAPEVAFLYPGAGQARLGMGGDLLVAFPDMFADGSDRVERDPEAVAALFPPKAFAGDGDDRSDALARMAGPATTVLRTMLVRLLRTVGITADHEVNDDLPESDLTEHIRDLAEGGVRVFIEVGPGTHLTRLVERTLVGIPHVAVALDRPDEHGITGLLDALARLAVAGVPVDVEALHVGRASDADRWLSPDRSPGWVVNGHFARTATGGCLPKGLRPADQAPPLRVTTGGPDAPAGANGGSARTGEPGQGPAPPDRAMADTAVVTEYLRIIHSIITTNSELVRHQSEQES